MGLIISHISASSHASSPVVRSTPTGGAAFGLMAMTGAIGFLPDAGSKLTGSVSSAVDGHWPGTDCFFYVSGSSTKVAVFGGDLIVSGNINGGKPLNTTGTPLNNQVAIFVDSDTVEGDASFTFDDTTLQVGSSTSDAKDLLVYGGASGKQLFWDSSNSLLEITGSNGSDALYVSDGNVRITDTLNVDGTADFDVSTFAVAASSVVELTSSVSSGQAIQIHASNGSGGVDIDAGSGGVAIDTTGALSLSGSGNSDLQVGGTLDIDARNAITIDSDAAGVSIDAAGSSNFTTSKGSVTISSEANRLFLTGAQGVGLKGESGDADAVAIQASNAAGGITLDAGTSGISLDATGASNFSVAGAGISLSLAASGGGSQEVDISSAGTGTSAIDISATAGGVDIDAEKAVTIDAKEASHFKMVASDISPVSLVVSASNTNGSGAGNLVLGADHAIDVNAIGSNVTIDAGGGISLDAAAASNFTTSGGAITINGKTGINIQEDGTNVIVVDDTQELTLGVSGKDVIIAGDLQVQGSTTTVSSSNTTIQDSIIGLGVSGSEGFGNAGDRAIIFARSANAHDALPALNYNGTKFELAKYTASPLSSSMGTAASYVDLKVNSLELVGGLALPDSAGDHSLTLEANGDDLSADRTLDFIVADSGGTDANRTLHIEADTVKLDQDYTVDATVRFSQLQLDSANHRVFVDTNLIVSSSTDIILDSRGSDVIMHVSGSETLRLQSVSSGAELDVPTGDFLLDVAGDISLDADGGNVILKDGGTSYLDIGQSSGDAILSASVHNKDVIFHGNNATDVFRLDSSANSLFVASGKKIELGDSGESIVGDGTDLAVSSSNHFTIDAAADIILDAGGANVTLKDDGSTFLDFVNSSGNVTLDGAGSISIDSHVGTINLMKTGSSGLGLTSVQRGFQARAAAGNLLLDSAGGDIEINNHLIPFTFTGHSNDGKYELGLGVGLKGATSDSQLGSSSTPFAAAFTQSNGNNASSISMSSTSTEFGLLLELSSISVDSSAISDASTAFASLSAGSLSTSTTSISQALGGHSMSLSKGQLLIFQSADLGSKMVFIVTEASSPSDSTIFVKYHSGLTSGNASSLSDLASGKAFSGSVSNGGLSLDDESLLEFTVGGETFIFRLKEAVTSSSSVFFVRPVSGGTGSSFNPTASGRTAKKGGTITSRNAWKNLHTDNIDIANSGIISLGGPDARLDLDTDDDTSIRASADDVIDFELGGTDRFQMTTTAFVPGADNSYDLGSETLRFRNIFTGDLNLRNDRGDWTLIEETDFISFRNNKTGRRFRMVMEDITGLGNYGPGNDGEM